MNYSPITPEAQFDSLSIGAKLYSYFDGFNRNEIQLFAYFSSLMFPYTNEPLSEWKYKFIIDENGYPFSAEVNKAIDLHILNSNFVEKQNNMVVSTRGLQTFDDIKDFNAFTKREKAISAVCTTTIMIPLRETESALLKDPEIAKNQTVGKSNDWIDQDFVIGRIKEVSSNLGVPIENLIASSVSWIKYLSLIEDNQE